MRAHLSIVPQAGSAAAPGPGRFETLSEAETEIANLKCALATARTIGVAMGILVERFKLTPDEAFARLVTASQNRNMKLRDLAWDLAHTGRDPLTD